MFWLWKAVAGVFTTIYLAKRHFLGCALFIGVCSMQPFSIYSPSNGGHRHRRGVCALACVLWECVGEGFADPLLTLSWHSFPHCISSAKGMHDTTPTLIKEGCATLLWAYQHENTTSWSSVGGRSVIVSCQTSKVLLTASHLTFSSD